VEWADGFGYIVHINCPAHHSSDSRDSRIVENSIYGGEHEINQCGRGNK
jgi:hypothetical protein